MFKIRHCEIDKRLDASEIMPKYINHVGSVNLFHSDTNYKYLSFFVYLGNFVFN